MIDPNFRQTAVLVAIGLLLSTALPGCSGRQVAERPAAPQPTIPQADATAQQLYWWYAKFRIRWPEGSPPDWNMDVLLADRVVKPVLSLHREKIGLWRFHRRSVRDGAGHQFSFIFFADPQTAGRVQSALCKDPVVAELKADRRLIAVVTDSVDSPHRPRIEDTSDPNWPEELQKTWPFFIMGVSQTWLALIDQFHPPDDETPLDTEALLREYARIRRSIDQLWADNGAHAFLHHLNALFGYQPFSVRF